MLMSVEINGVAHINLTASDFARSREFYGKLLPYLGLKPVFDSASFYYCVGGRTGVTISPAAAAYANEQFVK
jgi:catechol 2,3-dioxygenase-like lactoylglutathione lyase family enzyme